MALEKILPKVGSTRSFEHPGLVLRDSVLPALRLSVSRAAREMLIARQTLHRILAGRAAITPDMAVRIERLCGVPSSYWLARQHAYEVERVTEAIKDLLVLIPSHTLPSSVLESMGVVNA